MTKIKISIASDHGGYPLKKDLLKIIQAEGYNVIDKGAYNYNPEANIDFGGVVCVDFIEACRDNEEYNYSINANKVI